MSMIGHPVPSPERTGPPAPCGRYDGLDLLRLASALSVFVFHAGFRMGTTGEGGGTAFPELAGPAAFADTGLYVFFAISGFVIALSAENRSAIDFAIGRVARLWPGFVVCAGLTALVTTAWPVPGQPAPTLAQWLAHLVILSRALGQPFLDGAYWTIVYEIVFYGWVFLALAAGIFETRWRTLVLGWLAVSMANELLLDSEILRKLLITEYSGYFAFGLALHRLSREPGATTFAVLAAAAVWAVAGRLQTDHDFAALYGFSRDPELLAGSAVAALALVVLFARPMRVVPPTVAIGLGALTYPFYLLHQHVTYATFARFGGSVDRWLLLCLVVLALIGAAFLVARLVEAPGRRLILAIGRAAKARLAAGPGRAAAGPT